MNYHLVYTNDKIYKCQGKWCNNIYVLFFVADFPIEDFISFKNFNQYGDNWNYNHISHLELY